MRATPLIVAAVGLLGLAVSEATSEQTRAPREVLVGDWGGDGISLTLSATGGRLEWACHSADIVGPVAPRRRGRFRASGQFYPGFGGPAIFPVPESRKPRPVRYRGRVEGDRMRLVIIRPGRLWPGEQRRLKVDLEKGRWVRTPRCL